MNKKNTLLKIASSCYKNGLYKEAKILRKIAQYYPQHINQIPYDVMYSDRKRAAEEYEIARIQNDLMYILNTGFKKGTPLPILRKYALSVLNNYRIRFKLSNYAYDELYRFVNYYITNYYNQNKNKYTGYDPTMPPYII